jgi:membrane protein implicated in regulation of membrane protease activity
VLVGGELWSAEAEDPEAVIEIDGSVEVTGVDGLRLSVRPHSKKQV